MNHGTWCKVNATDYDDENPESWYLGIDNVFTGFLQRDVMTKTVFHVIWCELNVSAMHACMLCKCNR